MPGHSETMAIDLVALDPCHSHGEPRIPADMAKLQVVVAPACYPRDPWYSQVPNVDGPMD